MEAIIKLYDTINETFKLEKFNTEEKMKILIELNADLLQLYAISEFAMNVPSLSRRKRKRPIDPAPPSQFVLGECLWCDYITEGRHSLDNSREGKEFRKRFRVPWSFYDKLLKRIRSDDRLSQLRTKKDGLGRPGIPMEILVLICFRLLGRYPLLDELTEHLSQSSYYLQIFRCFLSCL